MQIFAAALCVVSYPSQKKRALIPRPSQSKFCTRVGWSCLRFLIRFVSFVVGVERNLDKDAQGKLMFFEFFTLKVYRNFLRHFSAAGRGNLKISNNYCCRTTFSLKVWTNCEVGMFVLNERA